MWSFVLLFSLILFVSREAAGTSSTAVACEYTNMTIICSSGIITTISANFGRLDLTSCPSTFALGSAPLATTTCVAPTSLSVMSTSCNGKSSCQMYAARESFGGDPCPNIAKYLTTTYSCPVPQQFNSSTTSTTSQTTTSSVATSTSTTSQTNLTTPPSGGFNSSSTQTTAVASASSAATNSATYSTLVAVSAFSTPETVSPTSTSVSSSKTTKTIVASVAAIPDTIQITTWLLLALVVSVCFAAASSVCVLVLIDYKWKAKRKISTIATTT